MPQSPNVRFKIENNNVQQSFPSLGVSCMIARTTKGPLNDPSEIISSYPQFQRIYGEEILAKNTISPIQKALEYGSKLRIIRVGTPYPGTFVGESDGNKNKLTVFKYTNDEGSVSLNIIPSGNGDLINGENKYKITFSYRPDQGIISVIVKDNSDEILESSTLFKHQVLEGTGEDTHTQYVDASSLSQFALYSNYLKFTVDTTGEVPYEVKDVNSFAEWVSQFNDTEDNGSSLEFTISKGVSEGPESSVLKEVTKVVDTGKQPIPSKEDWENAFDALLDYTDVYQVTCSNINNQEDETKYDITFPGFHKHFVDECKRLQEYTYYIELPVKEDNVILSADQLSNKAKTWQQALGYSEYVAYFTGGLKMYNEGGVLVDTDCIGPILGLGDTSATESGPWKSFAGMNRGLISQAVGPVIKNYGSPSRYEDLNLLAENFLNVIVIKDTPSSGKSTMLWHCFTSKFKQDSEKFLSIVRLNLYLKKNLRPILEKYLEEPNIWTTWLNIYLEAKPILDDLITDLAISEYSWNGDQNASSYEDLTVNNEADVRQGKYKVVLTYKDIVPMQDIHITFSIDKVSQTVTANIE